MRTEPCVSWAKWSARLRSAYGCVLRSKVIRIECGLVAIADCALQAAVPLVAWTCSASAATGHTDGGKRQFPANMCDEGRRQDSW